MADMSCLCVICLEGASSSKKHVGLSNYDMILELIRSCHERVSLGQNDIQQLKDRLDGMNESERQSAQYHSDWRKPSVNKTMIDRLKRKADDVDSHASNRHPPGRLSQTTTRTKRIKTEAREKVCIFSSFCHEDNFEPLHLVMSDDMGKTLIQIKQKTLDDEVRICVSDLHDEGGARALEKYQHRRCLRSAQRSLDTAVFTSTSLVRSLCDEELLISVENSLADKNGQLSIADVIDAYLSIMRRYQI